MLTKLLLLIYFSGAFSYALLVSIGAAMDKDTSSKVIISAMACTVIWPVIVAVIIYHNTRRNK